MTTAITFFTILDWKLKVKSITYTFLKPLLTTGRAITSLLIQRRQDRVIVSFRVAQPLARQHFLNTEAVFRRHPQAGSSESGLEGFRRIRKHSSRWRGAVCWA